MYFIYIIWNIRWRIRWHSP